MRLTVYTDYTLRVLIYLALKHREGSVATIDEMARAYGISRNHLMKIVHELGQHGFIETVRGRAGGARLARAPSQISIGDVVRMAEKDFSVVQCHERGGAHDCAILATCNLKRGLQRAVEAFMRELDRMTLADAVDSTAAAAQLLGMELPPARGASPVRAGRKTIPIVGQPAADAAARPRAASRSAASRSRNR